MSKYTVIPLKSLLYVAEPIIIDIVKDIMITKVIDQELIDAKNSLWLQLTGITGTNHLFLDYQVIQTIKSILNDKDLFVKHGDSLISVISKWVSSEVTHWESALINPVINILKAMLISYQMKKEIDVIDTSDKQDDFKVVYLEEKSV